MKIENQVCTLEQAKKLKELGVRRESIWVWIFPAFKETISSTFGIYYHLQAREIVEGNEGDRFDHDSAAAYTVAELGEMLPDCLVVEGYYRMHPRFYKQEQNNSPALWTSTYGKSGDKEVPYFNSKNEAEARANMLIYLIENNLITAEQVNERLTK